MDTQVEKMEEEIPTTTTTIYIYVLFLQIPQVFLQNDQTPMNDDTFDRNEHDGVHSAHKKPHRSMNDPKPIFLSSTYTQKQSSKMPKTGASDANKKDKQLRRNMRRKCKKLPIDQRQNCTKAIQKSLAAPSTTTLNATRSFHVKQLNEAKTMQGMSQPYQNFQYINAMLASSSSQSGSDNKRESDDDANERALEQQILQRTIRSHQRRNIPPTNGKLNDSPSNGKHMNASMKAESFTQLNPDQCYKLNALSHSQQKLCATNTQIMPAISRGARAAIQVRQFFNVKCIVVGDIVWGGI